MVDNRFNVVSLKNLDLLGSLLVHSIDICTLSSLLFQLPDLEILYLINSFIFNLHCITAQRLFASDQSFCRAEVFI
jgi:hypothetical protein